MEMHGKRGLVILGLGLLLAAIVWIALRPAPRPEPPVPEPESGARISRRVPKEEPREAEGGKARTVPPATPAPVPFPGGVLQVRDLADGTPVPGLRLRIIPPGSGVGPAEVDLPAGDSAGGVAVPEAVYPGTSRFEAEDGGWTVVSSWAEAVRSRTVWAYRTVQVEGTVSGVDAGVSLPPGNVRLQAVVSGKVDVFGPPDRPPWSRAWLRDHGVPEMLALGQAGPDGSFSFALPRIHGLLLSASARGWCSAVAPIALDSTTDVVRVSLTLQKTLRFEGVLRDEEGKPLAGARVVAYVILRGSYDDFTHGRMSARFPRGGWTTVRSLADDSGLATVSHWALTDDRGRFGFGLREAGEVWFVAYAHGHKALQVRVGEQYGDRSGMEFTAERSDAAGARVTFLHDGKPVTGCKLSILDLTREVFHPSLSLRTDAKGRISTEWLIPGHKYSFTATSKLGILRRVLPWAGQKEIQLQALPVKK